MSRITTTALALTIGLLMSSSAQAGLPVQVQEAESMKSKISGGVRFSQKMTGFGNQWSKGYQLFWAPTQKNDRLELKFHVPAHGLYRVKVNVTQANDFGTVLVGMNGKQLATYSGFSPMVKRMSVNLGDLQLKNGTQTLIFVQSGKVLNSNGIKVGIDNIELIPLSIPSQP